MTEALSDDGRRITSFSRASDGTALVRVVDLQGQVLLDGRFDDLPGELLEAGAGIVYVGGPAGTRRLWEGTTHVTRVVTRPTAMVAKQHDTIFVGTGREPGRVGPTALRSPGQPRWRARFSPVVMSPDGRLVLGAGGTIRRMADGRVVGRVPVPKPRQEHRFLGWGSKRLVLVETRAGRRRVLKACPVPRGSCRWVGSTLSRVSLPSSHSRLFRRP
ncbi:hypothetical protein [Nocardioides sp. SYSU D00038]|uniref:hypothetical protein n=1 Tax=Nocardioides sp. SYSU D00038 TaxID=2812554 RepID=UPI0019686C3B|nr:hypothetical protein [Nocardioides sp. SYSU D00038]